MANTLTQQMNIRIDSTLKEKGDSVFESLGLTPSQAIRAMYEAVVRHRYDGEFLSSLFASHDAKEEAEISSGNEKLDIARRGREAFDSAVKELGISQQALEECARIPDDELLEEALFERMVERGLV